MDADAGRLFVNGRLSSYLMRLDNSPTVVSAGFGPFASKTQSLPVPVLIKEEELQATPKDPAMVKWKCHSVSTIRDLPPILGRFNLYLSEERRRALHTHLTQISAEYA